MIIGITAIALLSVSPAPVEDWRKINLGGETIEIDKASIRDEGQGQRAFRARIAIDASTVMVSDNVMACAAGAMEMRKMETISGGRVTKTQQFAAGERRRILDESGDAIVTLVCG